MIAGLKVEIDSALTQVVGWMKRTSFYLMDIGIATALSCLQVAELGLGAPTLAWFDRAGIIKTLKIPWPRIALVIRVLYEAEKRPVHEKLLKAAEVKSSSN